MKKKLNKIINSYEKLINWLIIAIGVIVILVAVFLQENIFWNTVLISIGCSVLATGIVTHITTALMISRRDKKEIIDEWRLQAIFSTKAKMNERSNECLEEAKHNIDIIAVGMVNFLNIKKQLLEEKVNSNVQIRIISCDNVIMLEQREKDESPSQRPSKVMKGQVEELTRWVFSLASDNIKIKYHSTYPGFSYLRIDNHVFWGPNLPLYLSQQNFALEFSINGEGGKYLAEYFERLWYDKNICSDIMRFEEGENRKYE